MLLLPLIWMFLQNGSGRIWRLLYVCIFMIFHFIPFHHFVSAFHTFNVKPSSCNKFIFGITWIRLYQKYLWIIFLQDSEGLNRICMNPYYAALTPSFVFRNIESFLFEHLHDKKSFENY